MPGTQEPDPKNGGSRPVPDPTVLTTQLVDKAIEAERLRFVAELDVLRQQLAGMEQATTLRLQTIDHIPARIDEKIDALAGVIDERFASIQKQFDERDTRGERESRDNTKAVDAAFAAQKEAAAKQDESNSKAIDKSEAATAEAITKQSTLADTNNKALSDKIDDIKSRLGAIDATMVGMIQNTAGGSTAAAEGRVATASQRQLVTIGISAFLLLIAIIGFVSALQAKP